MRSFWWVLFGSAFVLQACGPIQATTAIARAEQELTTARLASADELAPYEYTKADLYLKYAKERQGFAEFRAARLFAEEAQRLAVQAKDKAPIKLRQKVRKKGANPAPADTQGTPREGGGT